MVVLSYFVHIGYMHGPDFVFSISIYLQSWNTFLEQTIFSEGISIEGTAQFSCGISRFPLLCWRNFQMLLFVLCKRYSVFAFPLNGVFQPVGVFISSSASAKPSSSNLAVSVFSALSTAGYSSLAAPSGN